MCDDGVGRVTLRIRARGYESRCVGVWIPPRPQPAKKVITQFGWVTATYIANLNSTQMQTKGWWLVWLWEKGNDLLWTTDTIFTLHVWYVFHLETRIMDWSFKTIGSIYLSGTEKWSISNLLGTSSPTSPTSLSICHCLNNCSRLRKWNFSVISIAKFETIFTIHFNTSLNRKV